MRQPRFIDNTHRKAGYTEETEYRWGIGEYYEPQVIEEIAKKITKVKVSYDRADKELKEYIEKSNKVPNYLLGSPDYCLLINNIKRAFVEIKIKAQPFFKSKNDGVDFPGYTTPSHYLDIVPVWENINAWCNHNKIPKQKFIFCFALNCNLKKDYGEKRFIAENWTYDFISLSKINAKIEENRYVKYAQGYGKECWLIPQSDTCGIELIENQF